MKFIFLILYIGIWIGITKIIVNADNITNIDYEDENDYDE